MKVIGIAVPTQYQLKAEELFWVVVMAVGLELLQVLATFQPDKIGDYRTWLVSLAGSLVRTGAGAALHWRASRRTPAP